MPPESLSFIARQPIFDRDRRVYAYELLFRSSEENVYRHDDAEQATAKVIADSLHVLGLDTLTGGRPGFFNVTREALLRGHAGLLPPGRAVIELLETIEPDDEVVEACRRLKQAGYRLALDDVVDAEGWERLLPLVDIVKVDFLGADPARRRELAGSLIPRGIRMLAEKVETREVVEEAIEIGYSYFQGYFYCAPAVLKARDIPLGKLNCLQIVQEVQRPELDFGGVADVIKREMSLCYKLLRFVNSIHFALRTPASSIERALVLMGEREVRRWASVVALAAVADDKPSELVLLAAARGRMCESICGRMGRTGQTHAAFLAGMLSLIDAVLDLPLPQVLEQLPVAGPIRLALLEGRGELAAVLDCARAYEDGRWADASAHARSIGLDEAALPELYFEALEWVRSGIGRAVESDAA